MRSGVVFMCTTIYMTMTAVLKIAIIEFMSTCGHNDFKINGTKRFKYVEANRTL